MGTVILTSEGINSTIASQNLVSLKKGIALIEKYCGNLEIKNSISGKQPFKKLKIKFFPVDNERFLCKMMRGIQKS